MSAVNNVYSKDVVIGVLAPSGHNKAQMMWSPTIDYLNQHIPDYTFKLLPASKNELDQAVIDKKVDFFITNTSHYVELEASHGATRILTLKQQWKGKTYNQWGSVFVVRAENNEINRIEDIKHKRIAGVYESAFAGYQVALRELYEKGILKLKGNKNVFFTGFPHSSPLLAVQDGSADVGIIPTGVLEEAIESGNFFAEDFKVIGGSSKEDDFPFQLSTRLYPYWPLAKSRHTSEELGEHIVAALLSIPKEQPSLLSGKLAGWTVPLEYSSVHELMRTIKVGPYENYGQVTFKQLMQQYWVWGLVIFIAFTTGVVIIAYISRLNRQLKLTRLNLEEKIKLIENYTNALEEQKDELSLTLSTLKQTQALLIETEKMAALGGLVSGVAHEVNTPIGIALTCSSLIKDETDQIIKLINNNKISEDDYKSYLEDTAQSSHIIFACMEKAANLVRSFKQVAVDQHVEEKRNFVLKDYCDDVITSLMTQVKKRDISINNTIASDIQIYSYAGVFSQIFTNLIMNSVIHAFEQKGTITIDGYIKDNSLHIVYSDNGKGIEDKIIKKIFDPFFTTNREKGGTGLGLHIIYNLINHKLNGNIICKPQSTGKGVMFEITIPLVELQENQYP